MAFMKDILTHNIPIWEECAATPFVQEVQTGKLPLEKFKRYMIQDSIYLKNYARIYGKAIFHAATLREIQLYYSMLNFVNDTESEVRLDYLKQFCITELERVKKLKKSIYEDYKDELISKEEFLSYREDYQQKETLYSKQIETLEEKKKESVTEDVFETPWLRRLLELKDIEELDRDIIVEMIDQITVYENRKLKISYNFGNELEHLFSSVYCEDLEKKAI